MTWRDKWNDINNRMHLERRALLQEMIDQKISRSQAALALGKATASVSNMVNLYDLNWPLFDGRKGGRRGYTPEQYRSFAGRCSMVGKVVVEAIPQSNIDLSRRLDLLNLKRRKQWVLPGTMLMV